MGYTERHYITRGSYDLLVERKICCQGGYIGKEYIPETDALARNAMFNGMSHTVLLLSTK